MSIENKIETAAQWMERCAANPNCGYDQINRWGPDYDCSSAVISAWEFAGVPVRQRGATYTGNMYSVFRACGFEDVTDRIDFSSGSGLVRGDVLLNHVNHTALYIGGGETAEASINEYGLTTGGETGDQTNREFLTRAYRNYPWDCVLRYTGKASTDMPTGGTTGATGSDNSKPSYFYSVKLPLLKKGHRGPYVETLQEMLTGEGFYADAADGIFGTGTEAALKKYQGENGLEADGECGGLTWNKLLGG